MNSQHLADYAALAIRAVPPPVAEACGNGWWRILWVVATDPPSYPMNFHMPEPFPGLDGLSLIVAVLPSEPGHIVIEHLTKYPKLIGEEAAYISLVLQALRSQYQQITIDGYTDHPFLHMAMAR